MDERALGARAGTGVALGFPLTAAVALVACYSSGLLVEDGSLWVLAVLPLLCALYGLFSLTLDERSWVGFERPTVILAGLVGGPLVGALCGVANGLGESDAVWRRRATYTGICCL